MSHDRELTTIEQKIAADVKTNTRDSWKDVYKELNRLYKEDGGTKDHSTQQFEDDLKAVNDYLHSKNLLPGVLIVDKNGQFYKENIPTHPDNPVPAPGNQPSVPATEGGPATGFGGSSGYEGSGGSGGGIDAGGSGVSSGGTPGASLPDVGPLPSPGGGLQNVNEIAAQDLGHSLWANWQDQFDDGQDVTDDGVEGCAASVSEVFQQAGIDYLNSASVLALVDQATSNGWTDHQLNGPDAQSILASAKPGDIIYGNNGGSDQHIGIIGEQNGQLVCFNNWSSDGKWHAEPLNSCYILQHFGTNTHIVTPPANLAAAAPHR